MRPDNSSIFLTPYLKNFLPISLLLSLLVCILSLDSQAQCGIDISNVPTVICDNQPLVLAPTYDGNQPCLSGPDCTEPVFEWSGTATYQADVTDTSIIVTQAGQYCITFTGCNCCVNTACINVTEASAPVIDPYSADLFDCNGIIRLHANEVGFSLDYSWTGPNGFTSNDENPYVYEEGMYYLTATNNNGCQTTDSTMAVEDCYDLALITILASGQDDTISVCDEVDFTVKITNQGGLDANNIQIRTQLPPELIFLSAANGGVHDNNNGTITWDLINISPNEVIDRNFKVKANSTDYGNYTVWAEIISDDGDDRDSTPDTDIGFGDTFPNDLVVNHNDLSFDDPSDEDDNDFESVYIGSGINLSTFVYLQGAAIDGTLDPQGKMVMRDDLRQGALVPQSEPYSSINGFNHVGDGGGESVANNIYNQTGETALVDWLIIDLRDTLNPAQIVSTRSAIVQRDGKVVDVDGVSPVVFPSVEKGHYHVCVRHRNHLGVMTADPIYLDPDTTLSTTIDFTDPTTETYGEDAQVQMQGRMALWAGDVNQDRIITYQGDQNETNQTFFDVLTADDNTGTDVTYIHKNYGSSDTNLDCNAIFQGNANDINLHFFNILNHPQNPNMLTNFQIREQLPE